MSERERDDRAFYVVDRIEGEVTALQDEAGREVLVPLTNLPDGTQEGDVLSVPMDVEGTPRWHLADFDRAEAARRRQRAEDVLKRLKPRR